MQQFSVKSLDYIEELQHPRGMKHCTQKTSDVFARQVLKMFPAASLRHDEQELEVDITKVRFSLLSSLSKATDSVQM